MGFADLTTVDVTDWPRLQHEPTGKRSKVWVTGPDGLSWLRKSVSERPPRPYEHLIEAFVLELAHQSGVESAFGCPCVWSEGGASYHGLLVRGFTGSHDILISGAQLLRQSMLPARRNGIAFEHAYTLDVVLEYLPKLAHVAPGVSEAFFKMLAFDAWVGNGDRHSENWSLLSPAWKAMSLAPMYDPAACLGSELQEGQVKPLISEQKRFETYLGKCPSGFGDGVSKVLRMSELVSRLLVEPLWRSNIDNWLNNFETAFGSLKQALGQGVSWLPESRQQLALKLLEARLVWLRESTRSA